MDERMLISPSRQRWIVISVAFSSFIVVLDAYIVNVSLPAIARYFNVGTSDVVHVIVAYLLIITSSLLLFGKLSGKFGFKRFSTRLLPFHRWLSSLRDFSYSWHS
jgi:MFS family permease